MRDAKETVLSLLGLLVSFRGLETFGPLFSSTEQIGLSYLHLG